MTSVDRIRTSRTVHISIVLLVFLSQFFLTVDDFFCFSSLLQSVIACLSMMVVLLVTVGRCWLSLLLSLFVSESLFWGFTTSHNLFSLGLRTRFRERCNSLSSFLSFLGYFPTYFRSYDVILFLWVFTKFRNFLFLWKLVLLLIAPVCVGVGSWIVVGVVGIGFVVDQ